MKFNKVLIVIFFLLTFESTRAQINRYMVFFSDKNGTPYSVLQPEDYLSPKALARRVHQNISITEIDLPVNPDYCQQLTDAGIDVYYSTKWLNGALVQCDASMLSTITSFNFVALVKLVAPNSLLSKARTAQSDFTTNSASTKAASTDTQLQMIGIDKMHQDGNHGEDITIAVIDAGFPGVDTKAAFQDLISDGRIDLSVSYDFVLNSKDVFKQNDHGTKVLSVIGGLKSPDFIGGAYKANFQLYITEHDPTEYKIEEYNWLFAAERADSAGADIITTSLGYNTFDDVSMNYTQSDMDGKTAVISKAARFASDRGVLVVCSAGNEGANSWHIITAPADVEDVLAIGNITAHGIKSGSSSVGPTADNRIKPDLVALGSNVSLIGPDGSIGSGSGTSFAAPLVAALAAGIWHEYPSLSNHEIGMLLKRTASQYNRPDNTLGYGIPNYKAVLNYKQAEAQQSTFEVFPNPFFNTLSIRSKNPDEIPSCTYQLITSQGVVLGENAVEFNWLNPTYNTSFSTLSAGLYFVRISWKGNIYTYKLLHQ